jgi:hypothetical protein
MEQVTLLYAHVVMPRNGLGGLASAKGGASVDGIESLVAQVLSQSGGLGAANLVEPTAALDAALGIPRCATVTYEEEAEHVIRILAAVAVVIRRKSDHSNQERYSRAGKP